MGIEQDISLAKQTARQSITRKVSRVIRQEINPGISGGLEKARQLVEDGYGLIMPYNHIYLRDGADVIEFVIQQPTIGKRPITSPVARHQYDSPFHYLLDYLQEKATINLYPIVNEDTKGRKKYKDVPEGEGMIAYLRASVKTLKNGGIVPVAIQTGRRSHLYQKGIKKSLSTLMELVGRGEFKKYAILFVGLENPGIEDYSTQLKKLDLWKTHRLNIGPVFTAEEFLKLAGDKDHIDEVAYKQLEPLVAKSYLKIPISSSLRVQRTSTS